MMGSRPSLTFTGPRKVNRSSIVSATTTLIVNSVPRRIPVSTAGMVGPRAIG